VEDVTDISAGGLLVVSMLFFSEGAVLCGLFFYLE
jgi:hypothetical protein